MGRFCGTPFSMEDLSNKFSHLANNSVQKHNKADSEIEGNMWDSQQLADHLAEITGNEEAWTAQVQPAIKSLVIDTIRCFQEVVVDRVGSSELYGFDVMLDDQLRPWLLEVNSSPVMEY